MFTSPPVPSPQPPLFNREMCMEFAIGSIAKMLGPEFAEVDSLSDPGPLAR